MQTLKLKIAALIVTEYGKNITTVLLKIDYFFVFHIYFLLSVTRKYFLEKKTKLGAAPHFVMFKLTVSLFTSFVN